MSSDPGAGRDADPPRRPLLGPVFWIVLVLSLVCVLAGAVLATLGPRLLRPAAATRPPALGERQESR